MDFYTRDELVQMYFEWMTGTDKTLSQSSILHKIMDSGFDVDEIIELTEALAEDLV